MLEQTVNEFLLETPEEMIKVIIKYVKPKNIFRGMELVDIIEWRFCDVIDLSSEKLFEATIKIIKKFMNLDEVAVLNSPSPEFVSFMKHIEEEFKKIAGFMKMLSSEPNADLINAGVENLDKFGALNFYYNIDKNPLTWDALSELPFDKMFSRILMEKEYGQVENKLNKIIQAKKGRK